MGGRLVLIGLFASLFLTGCPGGQCKQDSDCRAGMHCSTDFNQCVQCLQTSHCKQDEFCCRGNCRARAQLAQFCGCGPNLAADAGKNCLREFPLGSADVWGPVCYAASGTLSADNISQAACGCATPGECKTGVYAGKDMRCMAGNCVVHDACNNQCGQFQCIEGSCSCQKPTDCTSSNISDICVMADFTDYKGPICACSSYESNGNRVSCPIDQYCCGTQGCCAKPCDQASSADCKQSV